MSGKYKDLIYDVGMHKGEDTHFYLKKGFRVIAFEADPDLAEHCRYRFSEHVKDGRLTIVEGAIAEPNLSHAMIRFYRNRKLSVWGTVHKEWAERNEQLWYEIEIIEVQSVDFSQCLHEFGIPHFMKIDIEGSDIICLKALGDFDQSPDYVSIESEKVDFKNLRKGIDLLDELGYVGFMAVQQANILTQTPPNPSKEGRFAEHVFEPHSSGMFGAELSGQWVCKRKILSDYRRIFLSYKLFGDKTLLKKTKGGLWVIKTLQQMTKKPLPGWYDTHAVHSSVYP